LIFLLQFDIDDESIRTYIIRIPVIKKHLQLVIHKGCICIFSPKSPCKKTKKKNRVIKLLLFLEIIQQESKAKLQLRKVIKWPVMIQSFVLVRNPELGITGRFR